MEEKIILLIEDNPDDQELARRAFVKNHIINNLIIANDGEEALAYLFNGNQLPSLILLDLKLPKIHGLEVLRQIKANNQTKILPVVILTSSVEEQDVKNGYSLGANSYIRKPVDFTKFISTIHEVGLYWLELNELVPSITRKVNS